MAMVPQGPEGPGAPELPRTHGAGRVTAAWSAAALAGSAVLGLAGGLLWGEWAPRVLLQEVGTGTAAYVNVESRAFFGGDVWFGGIAVVAGLLTGILGYRFALGRREGAGRAAVAAALILGAVAGSLVMLWLGTRIGLAGYNHQLASSPVGTRFSQYLALGSKSALALWPLCTSAVLLIAEWSTRPAPERFQPGQPAPPEHPAA